MSLPYQKDIMNTVYHSVIITGLTVLYIILGRKLVKLDVGDPSRPDLASVGKMALAVTAAEMTKECLVKNKIIPDDIVRIK